MDQTDLAVGFGNLGRTSCHIEPRYRNSVRSLGDLGSLGSLGILAAAQYCTRRVRAERGEPVDQKDVCEISAHWAVYFHWLRLESDFVLSLEPK